MNTIKAIAAATAITLSTLSPAFCQPVPRPIPGPQQTDTSTVKDPINYTIRVEWKETKGDTRYLEVVTTEGNVDVQTFLPDKVKVGDTEVAISASVKANLFAVNEKKGRVQLFLGRSIPYLAPRAGNLSSYETRSVGLSVTVGVTFGKPLVIQSDENEKVTILVKRDE